MSNDVHVMVLAVVASQAAIAVLLVVMASLEPTGRERDAPRGAVRQVPVRPDAERGDPADARRR